MSVIDGRPLSNTAGSVLDPIFSLRRRVRLAPGETRARHLLDAGRRRRARRRSASPTSTATRRRSSARPRWPGRRRRSSSTTSASAPTRPTCSSASPAASSTRTPRCGPPPRCWRATRIGASPSGPTASPATCPIVLVRIDEIEDLGHRPPAPARPRVLAHEGAGGRPGDPEREGALLRPGLQAALEALVRTSQSALHHEGHEAAHGSVFILRADLLTTEARGVLLAAARAVLLSRDGDARRAARAPSPGRGAACAPAAARAGPLSTAPLPPLPTSHRRASRARVLQRPGRLRRRRARVRDVLGEGQWTPAPWINVVANPAFGFQVSESGAGYTWSRNSRENQLTPWSNDPVSDPPGEIIYVRDEETGELWGPTALPIREDASPYVARHGQGYSRFEHTVARHRARAAAIRARGRSGQDLPAHARRTASGRPRRLSVTAYVEWVLGASRSASAPVHRHRDRRADTGRCSRATPGTASFGDRVAFADLGGPADRLDRRPHGVPGPERHARSSGRCSSGATVCRAGSAPGLDPCAALQTAVELGAGRARPRSCSSSARATTVDEARALVAALPRQRISISTLDEAVTTQWDDIAGAVQVKTPDRSMDLMLNRWLLYQTLACRVWARSAFYQAGGAYGFRDQLQDVMALTVARARDRARAPPARRRPAVRRGRRPALVASALRPGRAHPHLRRPRSGCPTPSRTTWRSPAMPALLDEAVPFLEGPPLAPGQEEAYFEPNGVRASRARSSSTAPARSTAASPSARHGLPLMGTGDWNDGMNRVGREGQGESVWLGWFLHTTLVGVRADRRKPAASRRAPRRGASTSPPCKTALEQQGWDGDWYRRAFFDDGTPLGSAVNDECRIDSIAQSWAVISGAAEPARAARAMAAVEEYLVRREDRQLVLLFTPPFDRTPLDPGYIKGYPPGVRENGGQYTHAAIWSRDGLRRARRRRQGRRAVLDPEPDQHARARGPESTATRSSPTSWPPTSTPSPRTSAAAAGPGTPAPRAGCTAPASSGILGFRLRGATLSHRPLHPARLARLRDHVPLPRRRVFDHHRKPPRRDARSHRGGVGRRSAIGDGGQGGRNRVGSGGAALGAGGAGVAEQQSSKEGHDRHFLHVIYTDDPPRRWASEAQRVVLPEPRATPWVAGTSVPHEA